MKNLLTLVAICLFTSLSVSAQYKYFVGGQLAFSSNDAESNFGIKPNIGYVLNDNMVLVGEVGFSTSTDKSRVTDIKSNDFD